ncbi:uncharacterized protein C2845_PM01G48650 [Panicum miliaceum]|uniref:Hyaluronan/mRNA-binding protein domain-containing protein n=1 Tax=Panicum miliaceum TaxID=4540 RepID=A0A3L6TM40_PANMI|nr:uncharacterized protein C2845_PM01G48650 [Panicum miliaceum]
MATYNFDLLELADGESGKAAVSVVISKKKSEAAAAKLADVAEPAAYDKPKYSYFTKLQYDNDSGSNYDGISGNAHNNSDAGNCGSNDQVCDDSEHYSYGHDKRQIERGHDSYSNGERPGNRQGQPRMKKVYVRKVNAGTVAEEKPEENVVSTKVTEQKEVNADNASESNKSAGGPAQDGPNNEQGTGTGERKFLRKERLNGSEKREKKNAKKTIDNESEKTKKQDYEVDVSKKQIDKQPLEEEKKCLLTFKFDQTLAEYERMREEKKKSSEVSKTEVRKVTVEEFKDLHKLEKKKLDDEKTVMKVTVQNGNGASTYAYNGGSNSAPRDDYFGPGRRDGDNRGNGGHGYGGYQGNGGYRRQQQQQQRRPSNDRYYGERRNSAPLLDVQNMSKFPKLPIAASARSTALASASAPAPTKASAPASA